MLILFSTKETACECSLYWSEVFLDEANYLNGRKWIGTITVDGQNPVVQFGKKKHHRVARPICYKTKLDFRMSHFQTNTRAHSGHSGDVDGLHRSFGRGDLVAEVLEFSRCKTSMASLTSVGFSPQNIGEKCNSTIKRVGYHPSIYPVILRER